MTTEAADLVRARTIGQAVHTDWRTPPTNPAVLLFAARELYLAGGFEERVMALECIEWAAEVIRSNSPEVNKAVRPPFLPERS